MTLEEIRRGIDEVDTAMKPLFLKRMDCAAHVAAEKAKTGGDVFVLERELAIIEKRASDVEELHGEYVMFLRHLMSLSRRYQYGFLKEMQDKVISEALSRAGLTEAAEKAHSFVTVSFAQPAEASDFNLFVNMAKLNGVKIEELRLKTENGVQQIEMKLCGSVNDAHMRQLLCQMGKEAEAFAVCALA